MIARRLTAIGLPGWIVIGAVAGILAGVVLGERTGVLRPIGSAYAMMLEMAVYPYLICSLLHGLGRLTPSRAGRLLRASWGVYVFVWAATLGSIWLISWAIPAPAPPSVLRPMPAAGEGALLDLIIPANLFDALGRNYVPAIVVFAIAYGVAIQTVERKAALFESLQAIQAASVTIWRWIVRLAPVGVFALFAGTAGAIQPDRLAGLLLYVGLFMAGTLLLAFVLLPGVLAMLVPVGHRALLKELQPAFVLALVTTLSVAALPAVQKAAERLADAAGCPPDEERTDVIQASLSISYVLAQLGNYFVYLLMLYAAYGYSVTLTGLQSALLPVWSLLSGLGSPTATVDGVAFIASWLRLPPEVLSLYLETWTVTRYGQVALSVMGFSFVTILVPLIYGRRTVRRWRQGLPGVAAGLLLLLAIAGGGMALGPALRGTPGNALMALSLDPELVRAVRVIEHKDRSGLGQVSPRQPTLGAIQQSGVLRVGYNPNVIPFSYRNGQGRLVGYDVAYVHQLARDLHVALELIPFDWQGLVGDLEAGRFDLAIGGIYVTDDRLQLVTVSRSYYQNPVGLIVPSDRASRFLDRTDLLRIPGLRLAAFDDPVLVPMLQRIFPGTPIEVLPDYDALPAHPEIDAAIWTVAQAGAWAAAHPGYTAVAPSGMGSPMLLAYLLPPGAEGFRQYLDQWLELKASDGFRARELGYWLEGKPRAERRPRWNLLDLLLGPAG